MTLREDCSHVRAVAALVFMAKRIQSDGRHRGAGSAASLLRGQGACPEDAGDCEPGHRTCSADGQAKGNANQ